MQITQSAPESDEEYAPVEADESSFLSEYLAAKADADRAQRRLNRAQGNLTTWMQARKRKSLKVNLGMNEVAQITYVQSTRFVIDEKKLRRALTAKVFDKLTEKKLIRSKLEEAMDTGDVDPVTVAKYISEEKNKPFLKYTVKEAEEVLDA